MEEAPFEKALESIPLGYSEGEYEGARYGVTLRRSEDGKRVSLFARQLAGPNIVSFNLFKLRSGKSALKPCEMSSQKVMTFVSGYTSYHTPPSSDAL